MLEVRRWRELVAERKNGRKFFDRPKPTVGCSANGRRRIFIARSIPALNSTSHYFDTRYSDLAPRLVSIYETVKYLIPKGSNYSK